jgi:hypothetical protein
MLRAAFRCFLAVAFLPTVSAVADACTTVDAREVLQPGLIIMSAGRERPTGADHFEPCFLQLTPGAPGPQSPLLVASAASAISSGSATLDPSILRTFVVWLSDRLVTSSPPDS